ncbi:MAG: methyl-accepting chemotaxis protein [Burkholderiales bacterium]
MKRVLRLAGVGLGVGAGKSRLLGEVAGQAGELGIELCDIAGEIEEVAAHAKRHRALCEELRAVAEEALAGHREIAKASRHALEVAEQAKADVAGSQAGVGSSLEAIHELVDGVTRVENEVEGLATALAQVRGVAEGISRIARQSHLLSLNAAIEAARASESGHGFAVVAREFKMLAEQTARATADVEGTLAKLVERASGLIGLSGENMQRAEAVREATQSIGGVVERADRAITQFDGEAGAMASAANAIERQCSSLVDRVDECSRGLAQSGENFERARLRVGNLLASSETLIQLTAAPGVETADTRFIRLAKETAARVGRRFEAALASGEISEAELFDRVYEPVPGTDPQQLVARFTTFTDRALPELQEPLLEVDARVVFACAVDDNGYLPTHNRRFSQPQGPDPAWNAAHCRNRRLFSDRTGLSAGRSEREFLLQTYRRDMGGGQFALMKDVSAPIVVNGSHWGGFRIGYRA